MRVYNTDTKAIFQDEDWQSEKSLIWKIFIQNANGS